jgi:hypothetical protein
MSDDSYETARRYWDYSGGIATDLFVHRATRIIQALGLTFPERGVATGGKFHMAAIRSNEPLRCDPLLGYYGVVACMLGVESFRKRRYLAWDKAKQRLVNA